MLTCNGPTGDTPQAAKPDFVAWSLASTRAAAAGHVDAAASNGCMAACTIDTPHAGKLATAAPALLIHAACNSIAALE